jgi:GAF domain-containing protein
VLRHRDGFGPSESDAEQKDRPPGDARDASRCWRRGRDHDAKIGDHRQHHALQHPLVHVRAAVGADEVCGVLYVDNPARGQFTAAHLDAFTALTNAAAVAIEQSRLSSQLLEENPAQGAPAALSLAGGGQPDHPRT